MNASPHSLLAWMLMLTALVASGVGSRAAEFAPAPPDLAMVAPVAFDGDLMLEPFATAAEPLPTPAAVANSH